MTTSMALLAPPNGATRLRLGYDDGIGGLSWGAGPLRLVFVHANGFCASTYQSLLAPLANERCRIVALDLRGHGTSTRIGDPATFDRWDGHAADLLEAINDPRLERGNQPPVLAGHSMGGTSILMAATRQPSLARQILLFDPVLLPKPTYWLARLPGGFETMKAKFPMSVGANRRRAQFDSRDQAIASWTGRGAFKSWQEPYLADYCHDGLRDQADGSVTLACAPAFEAACFAAQRHNPYRGLSRLGDKVHIVKASHQSTTTDQGASLIKKAGGVVTTVPDTTHFLPMTHRVFCQEQLHAAIGQPVL
jgi:pimeloyl-ACP methyl ester carboxylesterase